MLKNIGIWVVIGLIVLTVIQQFDKSKGGKSDAAPYSTFIEELRSGRVSEAAIEGRTVLYKTGDARKTTYVPGGYDKDLINDLIKNNVKFEGRPEEQQSVLSSVLFSFGPILLLIAAWVFMMRQMQGGGKGGAFSFGKSKARLLDESNNTVTFADVAGCDEAKEEVSEIVDFLKDPSKFQKLGGRIPRGVLMVGSPGTGKTLLAKAIAGEAKVPFFSISGSDFVEMFVGVGASRVRDMFEQAKKNAPCIIFIDEIDAVGRQRGAGVGGGNDEREQTLNQMLVEMDGFEGSTGVIVIAATNRPDVLDPALLRPGRFDRQVTVPLPDIRGREQILGVHMRKVPIASDVNASVLARGCPGFSGADIANLVNEAALFAARSNKRLVDMEDFERAKDKIYMGAERKSLVMTEQQKTETAYHEAGHALVACLLERNDPVHKVTIIPRGRALGVTWMLPKEDSLGYDREQMLHKISMGLGGRIAEEIFCGKMTTGASSDFQNATSMARDMVTRYGMSDELGPVVYAENEGEVFLGRSVTQTRNVSESTLQKVDSEIRRIIDEQYKVARALIEANKDKMEAMKDALMELETIDADQVADIMAGRPVRAIKTYNTPGSTPSGGGSSGASPVVDSAPGAPPKVEPTPTAATAEVK